MKITTHKLVSLSYDLNVGEGDELELMERATPEQPLEFIFGTNSMLEAFEHNLDGLSEGDSFSFQLTPEEAYGEYDDDYLVDLPRNVFEVDGKFNEDVIKEGNVVPMMDTNGNRLNGAVVEVGAESVKMDFNHPLAGETLKFSGKVLSVKDASPEEIAALMASQSCGCGSSGCDCGTACDCGEDGAGGGSCSSGCGCH